MLPKMSENQNSTRNQLTRYAGLPFMHFKKQFLEYFLLIAKARGLTVKQTYARQCEKSFALSKIALLTGEALFCVSSKMSGSMPWLFN